MTFNVLGEPLVELIVRIKQGRHDEVQEGPQLSHAILDGCARQEEPISTIEAQQDLPPQTVGRSMNSTIMGNPHRQPADWLTADLLLLLMAWASSSIRYCHLTLWKYLASATTS